MATQADAGSARSDRPTGTVTFLFSDIEGSTKHWEAQPAAMPAALKRHDELMRSAIESHGGHIFKTVGDAFCAAFSQPLDALAAAADAQRTLASESWSAVGSLDVRIALHSGTTDERDGDYFGSTVNRVARLLGIAHGGQIVLSAATALLLRGVLPDRTELRDLGKHRLKDLAEPEHVWQAGGPGLRDTFPPLASLGSLLNNLPRQVTPLVGRDDALAEIQPLVLEHPAVTLTGTGGVGKTRLALQAAANLLDGSDDGVWLVELASLRDPAFLVTTIASTFGLRERANRSMLDVLVQYLRPRRLLLILDNCEHLIDEAARVADAILRSAPEVRILATSREPLRIAGEHVYRVPSLSAPSGDLITAKDALRYGAVALFADRAKASDSTFALTDENVSSVADICLRLDGIPLAIELAAARVNVLPPSRLAQKLHERFRVLTGGSRTALPRQQTMRALIDWSHDLLSEQEQQLFRRLAIFAGGWTLEASEAVCDDETVDAADVIDLLSSLVDKSLVVAEVGEASSRYRFLESTRGFALEKLEQSSERERLARRHAQWAADLGDRAQKTWPTLPTSRWRSDFEPEAENARSAIDWAVSHDEITVAVRVIVGLSPVYRSLVGELEIRNQLEALLERLDAAAEPVLAARAWYALSAATTGSHRIEAAHRAVELGERCNDYSIIARSLTHIAGGLTQAGRPQEARAVVERALALMDEYGLGRTSTRAEALNVAGIIAHHSRLNDEARQLHAEALRIANELGADNLAPSIRVNIAELEFDNGNVAEALNVVEAVAAETPGLRRASFDMAIHAAIALVNTAAYCIVIRDLPGARDAARKALQFARGTFVLLATFAIQHLATIAALNGDRTRAARLRGYVDASYRKEGCEREPTEAQTYDILMTALLEDLSGDDIARLAAEGAGLSEEAAVNEALTV